jgi:hypothetical protein
MASAGPAAGRGASTATAPAGSGWRSGIPAMASVGSGARSTDTDQCPKRTPPGPCLHSWRFPTYWDATCPVRPAR